MNATEFATSFTR